MSQPTDIDASDLAALVSPHLAGGLFAFDVDGVLAPLVDHADDSSLLPGVHDSLRSLSRLTAVGIVSGRAMESLERLFEFPPELLVIGSHGLEMRGSVTPTLAGDEQNRFDQLESIGARGVAAAGNGAWLEYKPASVVLHTREADPALASSAVDAARNSATMVEGAEVKPGSDVVELLARTASKGIALLALAERVDRCPITFVGDDVTDEEAFRMMGEHDFSIRVGPGESAARYRLPGPPDVVDFLQALTG